jgi:ABC-type protease/lipase transport system fused ATPase/permease subunit
MDETNSNLDEQGESALRQAIIKLQMLGSTFIITTHRATLVNVVDFALVLKSGRQVAFGPAKVMIDAARNAKQTQAANSKPLAEASVVAVEDNGFQASPLPAGHDVAKNDKTDVSP